MSQFSKRLNINSDVLLEYVYDDNNFKSEDYKILTNLKDKSKGYISKSGLNVEENNLVLVDPVTDKYSSVNLTNFNFLRLQSFSSSLIMYDTVRLYFTSGFDFYSDQLGFYISIYTYGYDNQTKYKLTDFYYTKDNLNPFNIFTLSKPFLYNGAYWVKSIEIDIPSVYYVANQRIITNTQNEPRLNSLNKNLTNGEGLSINSPIFIDFGIISSSQTVLGVPYYYMGDITNMSIPRVAEFDEIGVEVLESSQGDYFEIYSTYIGSNENMDNFVYNETVKGKNIQLNYIISVYEENILTSSQTIEILENFSQKVLYRPIILFSNTTAAIDVELRIINNVDSSYISKFGSIGITNSINKYGRTLSRLNLDSNVINTNIYNLKYKNVLGTNNSNGLLGINGTVISYNEQFSNVTNSISQSSSASSVNNGFDIVKVPYPVMYDKYNISVNSNKSNVITDYVSNGLLTIIITSFDNIINFNIAKDVNASGIPTPYNLADITNNSKLQLVFKSDTEKIVKDIYNDAENYFQYGIIYFKIDSTDYSTMKKIYNAGYDNFYIVITSTTTETQFFSGNFVFYEDVSFVNSSSTTDVNPTLSLILDSIKKQETVNDVYLTDSQNNSNTDSQKDATNINNYLNTPSTSIVVVDDSKYTNLMVYVRFQTNQDLYDNWLKTNNIIPKYKYSSVYFLERLEKTYIDIINKLEYVEKTFEVPLNTGVTK